MFCPLFVSPADPQPKQGESQGKGFEQCGDMEAAAFQERPPAVEQGSQSVILLQGLPGPAGAEGRPGLKGHQVSSMGPAGQFHGVASARNKWPPSFAG